MLSNCQSSRTYWLLPHGYHQRRWHLGWLEGTKDLDIGFLPANHQAERLCLLICIIQGYISFLLWWQHHQNRSGLSVGFCYSLHHTYLKQVPYPSHDEWLCWNAKDQNTSHYHTTFDLRVGGHLTIYSYTRNGICVEQSTNFAGTPRLFRIFQSACLSMLSHGFRST